MSTNQHHAFSFREVCLDYAYILGGALLMAFALKSFLVPNGFLDGGVTGLSLLIYELAYGIHGHHAVVAHHPPLWPLAMLLIGLNIPFIIMGRFQVSRAFVVKTSIGVLALCAALLIPFPEFADTLRPGAPMPAIAPHYDRTLISVFGGFFLGLGIGLGMRGGCALDGIEVLALYTLKRSSLTISEIILGINAVLFLLAATFVSFDVALYAILTYYIATRTIDYVIEGLEEYTGVTIISGNAEGVKRALVLQLGRGITVYKGERGYLPDSFEVRSDVDIVFTVVTRLEVRRLRNLVHSVDEKAFVFTNTIREAAGGVLKRRAGSH